MGCNASKFPNLTPRCSSSTEDRYIVDGWCGSDGPIEGPSQRAGLCNQLGVAGEWGEENRAVNGCFFPTQTNNTCDDNGPGPGGTGIAGVGVSCKRIAFKGTVSECCTNPGASCITSNGGTCDPQARTWNGNVCQQYALNRCKQQNALTNGDWDPNGYCNRALEQNILLGELGFADELGYGLLNTHFSTNPIQNTNPSAIQERIYGICLNNPIACERYLSTKLCSTITRQDITTYNPTQKFCGCYLPNNQYETFINQQAGISKACDSVCNTALNVPIVDSLGQIERCKSNTCIIDDVTLSFIDSNVGSITFDQLCGGCSNGSTCNCFLKDINIEFLNSRAGNIDFEQRCLNNQCFQTINGVIVEIPCEDLENGEVENGNPPPETPEEEESTSRRLLIIILSIIGFIIFILFVVVIIWLAIRGKKKGKREDEESMFDNF